MDKAKPLVTVSAFRFHQCLNTEGYLTHKNNLHHLSLKVFFQNKWLTEVRL